MACVRIFTLLCLSIGVIKGFKILAICPSPSYSHQQPFQALMKTLAARGHQVTVISPIPLKNAVENYRDIDVSFSYRKKDCTGLRHVGAFEILRRNMMESNEICEEQIRSFAVQKLLMLNESFDAIIIEQLWFQCFYSLVKYYDFPVLIGFLSVGNLPYAMDSVGNPDDPRLNPDMAFHFNDRMTTFEGIVNLLYTTATRLYYRHWHLPRAQQIASKIMPGTSVGEIDRNFSLVILGNNHVFGYPKPLLPNVVEVHSLQIDEKPTDIPDDIRDFLDDSEHGAIYFSLGSNLQTHQLPTAVLIALLDALGSLKQRILWKHRFHDNIDGFGNGTNGNMFARANNIKFVEWVPQQAVLAHPQVLVYVMQGGLQSLQEAVHYAVPVIAIPFFGDQHFNARKILDSEIGLMLDIDTITKETFVQVLMDVIENDKYRRNIRIMSDIAKDELVKPIDRAAWSIEHVLKFRYSKHLQYYGRDITYFQYYLPLVLILTLCIFSVQMFYTLVRRSVLIGKKMMHSFSKKFAENAFDEKTKFE